MKKWKVEGRLRADVPIDMIVEASTEQSAINKMEKIMLKHLGIDVYDILDTEYYAEEVK